MIDFEADLISESVTKLSYNFRKDLLGLKNVGITKKEDIKVGYSVF